MINLYNKDCMKAMRYMDDNQYDLAIVDPPYRNANENGLNQWNRRYGSMKNWENKPNKQYFEQLFRVSKNQIIWGSNNFTLPNYKGFVVWKKITITESFNMSMAEIAFLSDGLSTISKVFELKPQQKNRIHPTQKPIKLYEWLLMNYAKEGDKILDTHLGSGSIAIACHNLGYDLDGFEIDKDYYNDALKRFKNHTSQIRLYE